MAKGQGNCNAFISQCVYRERYDTPRKLGNSYFMTDDDSQISPIWLLSTPQTYIFQQSCYSTYLASAFHYTSSIPMSLSPKMEKQKNGVLTGLVNGIITLGNRWYVTASHHIQVPPA